jgi:hypothetical protein
MSYVGELQRKSGEPYNWSYYLPKSGYYSVLLRDPLQWSNAHAWATDTAGLGYYCWAGSVFYFNRESDALLFALQFG